MRAQCTRTYGTTVSGEWKAFRVLPRMGIWIDRGRLVCLRLRQRPRWFEKEGRKEG